MVVQTKRRGLIKKGFSMIELIIVIAVLGVLTAVVLSQAQGMRESANINKESSNLGMLVAATRAAFNSQGNYDGLQNRYITRSNSFPASMSGATVDDIRSSWSNPGVLVEPQDYVSAGDNAAFTVTYQSVPKTSCTDFIERNYTSFYRVEVGAVGAGTIVRDMTPGTVTEGSTITIYDACDYAAGSEDIVFWSR